MVQTHSHKIMTAEKIQSTELVAAAEAVMNTVERTVECGKLVILQYHSVYRSVRVYV